MVTEHPDIETKCEDLSKAFLILYNVVKEGKKVYTEDEINEIMGRLICE